MQTETLTNGLFTINNNAVITYINNAAEKIFEKAAENMLGKNILKDFNSLLPDTFYKIVEDAFLPGIFKTGEKHLGEVGCWAGVIVFRYDEFLSVSFKSSSREHSVPEKDEQRLKTLTELYRHVTEITNDALWERNLATNEIFWIDGGHKRVFGYEIENALIPQSFWEGCIHPHDKKRLLAGLNKAIATGQVKYWEDTYRFKKKDGSYAYVQDRAHILYTNGAASRMIGATQDISERVRLQKEVAAHSLSRQKEIATAVMATLEKERAEVGEELSEHVSQVLVAINMYIEIAKKNAGNREKYLDQSSVHVKELLAEIRTFSNRLLIPDIRVSGLTDNIKNLIADMARSYPVRIELLTEDIDDNKLSQNLQLDLYRIVQEQLTNVIKHSDATNAIISLKLNGKQLKMLIRDNGTGCDHPLEKKSAGISNIITRAQLLNGQVTLLSSHQQGYSVKMIFPL